MLMLRSGRFIDDDESYAALGSSWVREQNSVGHHLEQARADFVQQATL